MSYQEDTAKALLEIKAVGFVPDKPIRFKSGLLAPVYIDNRVFPSHPEAWTSVIKGFEELIQVKKLSFNIIAGIETAGIPHSAALGFYTQKPSVFVRKQVKDHGTKKMVEGGDVSEKKVLLIEDHVTTGGSSLAGVQNLREAGATVEHCLAITSYEFPEAQTNFSDQGVQLFTLTTFPTILQLALNHQLITISQKTIIEDWFSDAKGWGQRQGLE